MGEVWRARDTRIDGPGVPAHAMERIWELLDAGYLQPAP